MESKLDGILLKEICEQVPSVFNGDNHAHPPQDNILSQLSNKLELIFSRGTPPDQFYKNLKEQSGGSTVCGRVFDRGDYFYTCVECRTDPTCVFCKECFFASTHVSHSYKMFASGGAGCCDCGDAEAWTKDPHCDNHKPQAASSTSDALASLPEWLINHGHAFCHFIFEYALVFQNYTDWQSLPSRYQMELEDSFLRPDSHCLMLMNDEVNTFNDVVSVFTDVLKFTNRDSLTTTYAIDKVGRGLVFQGSEKNCFQKQMLVPKLLCKVLPIVIAQHQECSVFLLNTLLKFSTQTPGLKKLCGLVLCSTDFAPANGSTILDYIFSNFSNLWISACEAWMGIFLQIAIPQEEIRVRFADCYIQNYSEIMNQNVDKTMKEHCSLHFLSVQLFTSPSLALELIEHSQALLVILNLLENVFTKNGSVKGPISSSQTKESKSIRKRRILSHDLSYLVRHSPRGVDLTQPLQDVFLEGLKAYIRVLRLFEEADAVKKVIGIHILIEPGWKDAFLIQRMLQPITASFINWMSHNKALLLEAIQVVFAELKSLKKPNELKLLDKKGFEDYSYKSPHGTVSRISVSCHLPLTRLLSGLLSSCHLQGIDIYANTSLKEDIVKKWLFEKSIRPIVFKSQVSNQFWKRNGISVIHMVANYHSFMCNEMYYRDLYMLQLMAANLCPQYTLFNLIEKFEVSKWFTDSAQSKKEEDNFFVSSMCEEMMGTLIAILLERNNTNLAELTNEQVTEQNLINLLFIQEWSHSNLLDDLARGNFDFDYSAQHQLDTFLPKLAKECLNSGKKRFTLHPDYYNRVCLFFYHDSKENQSQAINQLKTLVKPDSDMLQTLLTPPILPNFRPHLRPLLRIFEHQAFLALIFIILDRALKEDALLSDFTVHQVLFLIALGLQEEENKRIAGFTEALKSEKFLNALSKLPSCASCAEIRPLIEWINNSILPKEEIKNISKAVNKQSLKQIESVKRGKMQQNRAMDNLKKQQAAFLERFVMPDDGTDDQFEDAMEHSESAALTQSITGVGLHCLNMTSETQTIDCIFCQESSTSQSASGDGKLWVLSASCISSSALKKTQSSIRSLAEVDVVLPHATLEFGVITKACGHCFHFSCWEQFMKSSSTVHTQLVISPSEFKCPLCYSVCNTILPLSLGLQYDAQVSETKPTPSFEQFLTLISLINNSKHYTHDAVKLATTFSECFDFNQQGTNSISLYTQNSNTFKILEKCIDVGYPDISPDKRDPSFPIISVLNTLNYTLQAKHNEMVSLEQDLLKDISSHQQLVFRSLIHLAIIYDTLDTHQVKCECANRILHTLITTSSDVDSRIFDHDAFSLLINLQISLPHLISQVMNDIPNPSISLALLPTISRYVFKLLLYYHIVQVVMFLNLESISTPHEPDGVNRDPLFKLWSLRRKALPETSRRTNFSMKALHDELLIFLLPFLRSCSLFYNLLFGVPLPKQESMEESSKTPSHLEVDMLLAYLDCPAFMECLSEMFADSSSIELIRTWFAVNSSSSLVYAREIQHPSLIIFPYGGLITLPDPYLVLLSEASNHECPITSRRAEEVIKCLVCGQCMCLLCFACSETNKHLDNIAQAIGPFTAHMMQCSNGIGVGIWVKQARLVLLSARFNTNRILQVSGTYESIPYLDRFGEHDPDLMKGSPLFFSPQEYMKLKQMWLQNDIPRNIEKSRDDHPFFLVDWKTF